MSRGFGWIQRAVVRVVMNAERPLTYAEIFDRILGDPPLARCGLPFERSLRRTIQREIGKNNLIAIGSGGRADPHRYYLHPGMIASIGAQDSARAEGLYETLRKDPDAEAAILDLLLAQADDKVSVHSEHLDAT
jgi:hypothetical protein